MRSQDTSPEAHEIQLAILRAMAPSERLERALTMGEEFVAVIADGIRFRHPDYNEDQVHWALLRHRHGDELFRKVWPGAPLLAP